MYTTTNESGQLNNYAKSPKMYYAEYPTLWEQRQYVRWGALAALLVSATIALAFVVS